MKVQGEIKINSAIENLWNFLSRPEEVSSCFPGIKKVEKISENEYKIEGTTGIGFIKGDYRATVKFLNITPMKGYTIQARGNGLSSTMDITANIELTDNKPVTMKYNGEVKVGGVLASIGARLMDSAVEKILQDLFQCIKNKVEKS
jgi:carbon monoxide dehydrogenase subunit G